MSKKSLFAGVLSLGLLIGAVAVADAPVSAAPEKPVVAQSLMGSKPPEGDPLKLGKQITGNPHAGNAKLDRSVKGRAVPPRVPGNFTAKKAPAGTYYKYAVGNQVLSTPSTGVSAILNVTKPYVNPTYDWHTLTELSAQSDDGQIVEVGWTRDQYTYGDNNVHLFVYHWVNGTPTCYDGCGWVDYSANTTSYAGMSLENVLQTTKVFAIERTATAWWIGYDGQWIGSFPDTIWSSATPSVTNFNQVEVFQGFGEVAAGTNTSSCADMGAGPTPIAAGSAGANRVASVTYSGRPTSEVNLSLSQTASQWPVASVTSRTFAYGGGGYC